MINVVKGLKRTIDNKVIDDERLKFDQRNRYLISLKYDNLIVRSNVVYTCPIFFYFHFIFNTKQQ